MPLDDSDKQWMTERITEQITELITGLITDQIREVHNRIEKTETALLTEFHKWASPTSARINSHAAAIRALDAQQEYLEDRISKLEGSK